MGRMRYFSSANMFPSPYQSETWMFLNRPSYTLKKVSKTSQQHHSGILWWSITTPLQQNSVAEFYGKILQQRYNRTVSQQNSVAEHSNVKTEQYREQNALVEYCSKMLGQNTTIPQWSSMALHQNAVAKYHYNTIEFYNRNILRTLQQKAFTILGPIL